MTETGDPKLLDFGIAKLLGASTPNSQTALAALTPEYASSEQVRSGPITTASDVYSLGVVLYQLMTNRKAYQLQKATVVEMDRIVCERPPAAPDLCDELDNILRMALRKEPERRFPSV